MSVLAAFILQFNTFSKSDEGHATPDESLELSTVSLSVAVAAAVLPPLHYRVVRILFPSASTKEEVIE